MGDRLNELIVRAEREKHSLPISQSDLLTELIDEFQSRCVQLDMHLYNAKKNHRYWYEKNRLLEERIRKVVKECFAAPNGDAAQDAAGDLLRCIPKKPRKTWRELWRR